MSDFYGISFKSSSIQCSVLCEFCLVILRVFKKRGCADNLIESTTEYNRTTNSEQGNCKTSVFRKGKCTFSKIIGAPWIKGIVELEVDKESFEVFIELNQKQKDGANVRGMII